MKKTKHYSRHTHAIKGPGGEGGSRHTWGREEPRRPVVAPKAPHPSRPPPEKRRSWRAISKGPFYAAAGPHARRSRLPLCQNRPYTRPPPRASSTHLRPALDELQCHLLLRGLVLCQDHKPEGAMVDVTQLLVPAPTIKHTQAGWVPCASHARRPGELPAVRTAGPSRPCPSNL